VFLASILVGAPKESESGGDRTGAVYRCDLNDSNGACNRLETFERYDGEYHCAVTVVFGVINCMVEFCYRPRIDI